MYKRYTFDYKRFLKNLVLTIMIWSLIGFGGFKLINKEASAFASPEGFEEENSEVYFGFKDTAYNEVGEAQFLHALNMEELMIQPETDKDNNISHTKIDLTKEDLAKFNDINYLKNNFYIIDKRTDLLADDIRPEEFLAMDFSVATQTPGPKVLIFHTHLQEMFADSKGTSEGVWGVGEALKKQLESKYGIEVLHYDGVFDVVDGKPQILGAYERMEPEIRQLLKDNPTIEVVIDMHRDGVREDVHLVREINGKQCAQVMFFNGLCRVYDNGVLEDIESLKNVYLNDNLALSFNLQLTANTLYPGFTRKVYINAYRYSLHMKAKSMLIEVGAQTNTFEEAKNAMEPLSDIIGQVLSEG